MAEEHLVELRLLEGADHPVRMAQQVDVAGLREALLGPLQDVEVQRIGGGLVDQQPAADPLLKLPVEGLGGPPLGLEARHLPLRLLRVTPPDLHHRPRRPLQPEAEALAEGRPPLRPPPPPPAPPPTKKRKPPPRPARRSARVLNESSSSSGGANRPGWPASITRNRVEPERGGERTNTAGGFFGPVWTGAKGSM